MPGLRSSSRRMREELFEESAGSFPEQRLEIEPILITLKGVERMAVKWGEKLLLHIVREIWFLTGKCLELSFGIDVGGNQDFCTILFLRHDTFAFLLVLHVQLNLFYICRRKIYIWSKHIYDWAKHQEGHNSESGPKFTANPRSTLQFSKSVNPIDSPQKFPICVLWPNPLIRNLFTTLAKFISPVALIFTPMTNVLLYVWIVSTTGQLTSNMKGPSNIIIGPVWCIFSVTWLAVDVKEPTHLSKRVQDIVPDVAVYLHLWFHLTFHARVGWMSEIKYGLIAAARGAFTSWRSISANWEEL